MSTTKRILNQIAGACWWTTPESAIERITRIADEFDVYGVWHNVITQRTEKNDDAPAN